MASSPAPSDASHDSGDEHDNDNENENEHESSQRDGSTNPKSSVVKDKECQYCRQKFTSSSLGRHLDQFLNKKKPDGVHNVEEIRRLRGGITRRTARNSQKKEQETTVQPSGQSPSQHYSLPSYSELVNKTTAVKENILFNRANWQATGVITDAGATNNPPIAPIASPVVTEYPSNLAAGQKRSYSTYVADAPSATTSETMRALELSLREVLDVVRIATKKATPLPRPFDFDFESQTFPFLCLALLPVPPTLFQSTPFATATSVPLAPPGPDQHQSLRAAVLNAIDDWKWDTLAWIQKNSPPGTAIAEEADTVNEQTAVYKDTSLAHLDAAYQNFMSFGIETRHNLWTVELLRAYKNEQTKVKDGKNAAEGLRQELKQLQQQLDHLSRCQWPREMALWPPERPTFDSATQDELRRIHVLRGAGALGVGNTPPHPGSDDTDDQLRNSDRWDYERIISKWRRRVREDRARRTGVQPSVPLLQSGPPSGPTNSSDQAMNSPKSFHSNTPRVASTLYRSATSGGTADLTSNTRPPSRGLTHSNTSVENSPRTVDIGYGSSTINGITPNTPGPTSIAYGACNTGSTVGGTAGLLNSYATVPPPPRSRPLGIISDVDEYYGPRLAGLRREPPSK